MISVARSLAVVVIGTLLTAASVPARAQDRGTTTVILVRHAEKVDDSRDPALSASGEARARQLVHAVGGLPITAVLSTPFIRTRETARPLANHLGLDVTEVQITGGLAAYVEEIARSVRDEHAGEVVVVVGHSNTTPDVIRALGIADPPPIEDHEYDDLFVVLVRDDGSTLLTLRYGSSTP